jgi:hypothetical protein
MQSEHEKRLDEMINTTDNRAKRTTIILEKNEREYIDSLVRNGIEPGIKPLISKMLTIYQNMMIHDWRFPGEYYCGISRVALVNVEILNTIIQQLPNEKWYECGKNIGAALKVSMETTFNLKTASEANWEEVFHRLKIQGFGDFYIKDKYILIKSPFINYAEVWRGILEGLFETKLDTKTSTPPLVFEIKTKHAP